MMSGTYNLGLVALSYLIAVFASYTALELTILLGKRRGRVAVAWLFAGGFAMGIGIWTMHFLGMLAFRMRLPFEYDAALTGSSLLIASAVSMFALWIASRESFSAIRIGLSGLILGGGISAMHYVGMAAMEMPGTIIFDPFLVGVSILVGVVAATAALAMMTNLRRSDGDARAMLGFKAAAALVMGLAIAGMHYTGMAAARYAPAPGAVLLDEPLSNNSLTLFVALTAILILAMTHLTAFFDVRIAREQRRNLDAQRRALLLNELLDASSNEILVVDIDSLGIVNANQGAARNLGYAVDKLTTMSVLDLIPDSDEESFRRRIAELINRKQQSDLIESLRRRADGSIYPVQVHVQYSSMGDAPYLLIFASDITAKKSLEHRLDRARKLESVGKLAAGVAHEINTPAQYVSDNLQFLKDASNELLTLVDAFKELQQAAQNNALTPEMIDEAGDLLQTVDPDYLAAEVPGAIDQSLDGIARLINIVRAMKEFSHQGGNAHELTDINKSIQNAVTMAASEWRYVSKLETDLDPTLPLVPCRPNDISQVILHLVINAAHAIENRAQRDENCDKRIDVMTRRDGDSVEIVVSDTGSGIPPEVQKRIFDPWFTTKGLGKGNGQGLAVAWTSVVEGHGGTLEFDTRDGVGTSFRIRLPIDPALAGRIPGEAA